MATVKFSAVSQAGALRGPGAGASLTPFPKPIGGPKPVPREPAPVSPGTTGSAQQQAQALLNPPPVTTTTPVNPMQAEAYDAAKGYAASLPAGTNEMITRELQRARDEISAGTRAEGEAAMSRGADPTLFRARALAAGTRGLNELQGRLTDVALGKQAEAVGLQTGAAGAAANVQTGLHLGEQANQIASQREVNDRAAEQARLLEAPYNRLLDMMKSVGTYRDAFSGLSSGGSSSGGFARPGGIGFTAPSGRGMLPTYSGGHVGIG